MKCSVRGIHPGSRPAQNQEASSHFQTIDLYLTALPFRIKAKHQRTWKGQGWLPKYFMFFTLILVSSYTSLLTHSSRLSPGSTNPARTLNLPGGKLAPPHQKFTVLFNCNDYCRRDNGVIYLTAAGASHCPSSAGSYDVLLPQTPQYLLALCQSIK